MPPDSPRRVPCPDCGQEFTARGLPAHRRQRHGAQVQAPLPASVPPEMVREILSAIELLRGAVERMDERLHVVGNALGMRETPAEELRRLERELAARLEDIARIQQLAAAGGADLTSAPVSEEIGRLRREQARLVFRIDEIQKGVPSTERFLS